jgi:hypothetical protein
VCFNSFMSADGHAAKWGEERLGSDPGVRAHPECWAPKSVPPSERPNVWQNLPLPGQDERPRARSEPDIPNDEACVALETFTAAGRMFNAGATKVRRDDPVAQANPELFGTVPVRLSDFEGVK